MPQKIHPWNTKSRPAVKRIGCLAELWARPIQAEPVHMGYQEMMFCRVIRGPHTLAESRKRAQSRVR